MPPSISTRPFSIPATRDSSCRSMIPVIILHPGDAGYEAIANAVDLVLFRPQVGASVNTVIHPDLSKKPMSEFIEVACR